MEQEASGSRLGGLALPAEGSEPAVEPPPGHQPAGGVAAAPRPRGGGVSWEGGPPAHKIIALPRPG